MHVVVLVVLATKLCPTLWDPTNCSLPVSSIHGIFQASMLEWIAISFSRRYSWPRDWTPVSCIGRQILYRWATREAQLSAFVFYTWEDWPQCHHLTALPFSPGHRQAKYTSCSFTGMYTVNKHANISKHNERHKGWIVPRPVHVLRSLVMTPHRNCRTSPWLP